MAKKPEKTAKPKSAAPAGGGPVFSAGNVRVGIYHILHDLSAVEVEDELTLDDLSAVPATVRGRVNSLFFPSPFDGLSEEQVSGATTVFRLINTTIHTLEAQGRLKP